MSDFRNLSQFHQRVKFENKLINSKVVTAGAAVKLTLDLSNQRISTNGYDTLYLLIRSSVEDMPTFNLTVSYMRESIHELANGSKNPIKVADDDTVVIPATTSGFSYSNTIISVDAEKLQLSEWVELSFTEAAAAVTTYTYDMSLLKVAKAVAGATKITTLDPSFKTSGNIVITAGDTANIYVHKADYRNITMKPWITTTASVTYNIYGTLEDGPVGSAITSYFNRNDTFGTTAAFTAEDSLTDDAGILGGDAWIKVELTSTAAATFKLDVKEWGK